ncbi:zinc finger protein 678-like [Sitophilus oryzae]|uniref:Zinc finger protein 678-like n=1 Tax=Sitophilus oryzae TaxID=7048 RepID=A0A6J2Y2V0_SITOR|nr:zinc finger protein 678-like [Sitophilus oryzae]XP_030757321.1 zinc finger protein 678-like [Sitophilus oryzae]
MSFGNDKKPSIIQQIIIYNKPNIKHSVLDGNILGENGDIIISHIKKSKDEDGYSSDSSSEGDLLIQEYEIKREAVDETASSSYFKIEPADTTIPIDESNNIIYESESNSQNLLMLDEPVSENERPMLNSPDVFNGPLDDSANINDKSPELNAPEVFKRPRGRPRKTSLIPREDIVESPAVKRPRGRPKKVISNIEENPPTTSTLQERISNLEVPKKRGRPRKTFSSSDNLTNLLDDAQEHVSNLKQVDDELDFMFKKSAVEASNEDDDYEEEFDSDDDSRKEWVPEEYVEYKQKHLLKDVKKKYLCKFCSKEFPSYYTMRKHRLFDHNDLIKERAAGKPVKDEQEESTDDDTNHTDTESLAEWMPDDYAEYKLKHSVDKKKTINWFTCKICLHLFPTHYQLTKHKVSHMNKETPYKCNHCDDSFKGIDELMAHLRIHRGKDPYQCKKCDKGFISKKELDEHFQIHVLQKPAIPKNFRCSICSKEFAKLCDIERHTRVHTGEKPSECKICHKRFQQSHNLSKHLLIHLHVKPFQCEICNKKFGRIDVLNRHLLTHSMEKPFKCDECGKGFIRMAQLRDHTRKHHPSKTEQVVEEVVVEEVEAVDDS